MGNSLNTTFTRTFIFSIVLTLLICVLSFLLFRFVLSQYTASYHAQSMVAKYQLIETHQRVEKYQRVEQIQEVEQTEFPFKFLVEQWPVFSSNELTFYWQEVRSKIKESIPSKVQTRHSEIEGDIFIWFKSDGNPNAWIGIQLSHKNELFQFYGGAFLLLVFLISIAPSYLFARSMSQPIMALSEAAETVSSGGIPTIKLKSWPKEMVTLAKTLDTAAITLKDQNKSKEEMLLGISHDLRTPLTRARLAVDFLHKFDAPLVDGMIDDMDEMDLIIDQFIVFAREGRSERKVHTEINTLVKDVSERFEDIRLNLSEQFEAKVSPLSIRRMLTNLLSNAYKYGEPPVEVCVDKMDSNWSIRIIDHGEGIPSKQIGEALKPFTTLDEAGTTGKGGLGLAIVDRIVNNHGGTLEFSYSESSRFSVKVSFPYSG